MAIPSWSRCVSALIGFGFAVSVGLPFQIGCKSSPPRPTGQVRPKEPDAAAAAAVSNPPPPRPVPPLTLGCAANQVPIPGGTFSMGLLTADRPVHQVTLSPYCIDRTEVTVAAFRACVQAHKCRPPSATVEWRGIKPAEKAKWSQFCTWGRTGLDRHPINCVDWNQATAYCQWTGGRLPTEAEWEYAARGNDDRIFPWGNDEPTPSRLNACGDECASMAKERFGEDWRTMYKGDDGWAATAPVGSYPKGASPFGVLDMAGNVWEWTADTFVDTGQGEELVANPQGSQPDAPHRPIAIRGGSWNSNAPGRILAAYCDGNDPAARNFSLGFRCARGEKM